MYVSNLSIRKVMFYKSCDKNFEADIGFLHTEMVSVDLVKGSSERSRLFADSFFHEDRSSDVGT